MIKRKAANLKFGGPPQSERVWFNLAQRNEVLLGNGSETMVRTMLYCARYSCTSLCRLRQSDINSNDHIAGRQCPCRLQF